MFEATDRPRVFAEPPGVDFPAAVVAGLLDRLPADQPEALARVQIVANSARMARRLRDELTGSGALLLPRISLITDLPALHPILWASKITSVAPLRRRLDLAKLLIPMNVRHPNLVPEAHALDLADSLAALMDEMQGEGVPYAALADLNVTDQSGHWQQALEFLKIATGFAASAEGLDPEGAQRAQAEQLCDLWQKAPPTHPVIVVGSTGSRGTTSLLMQAIARLPQGALVLPGFDGDMPPALWSRLSQDQPEEDHPQYRYAALMGQLAVGPEDIMPWSGRAAPAPERNRLVSLALRPAPVTHHWLREGPNLGVLEPATAGMTLLNAPDPRAEANAIALRLRQAAEEGTSAALITPDRTLTRRVAAALDRWGVVADDSAGVPLPLTAPGRLLLQSADLMAQGIAADHLLALLKHPLTASAPGSRGPHLLATRAYELHLRRYGPPFPTPQDIQLWADTNDQSAWGAWLAQCLNLTDQATLPDWAAQHLQLVEALAAGPGQTNPKALWDTQNGRDAQAAMQDLVSVAQDDDVLTATDYARLLRQHLSSGQVRAADPTHPNILIWGALEARVQGADLVILGGLNDGVWPEPAAIDPWLNRALRKQAGLLLPERRIGLSAHDFQQAIGAPEVWVSRAIKTDEAETIPSRWVNRIETLLAGLPDQGGPEALRQMTERGNVWLEQAARLDIAPRQAPAERPAPMPPVPSRPARLSVTEIKTLIRDPYAIYAKHVLRLRPLDPLVGEADARMRGVILHEVMEKFILSGLSDDDIRALSDLEAHADAILASVPWPSARKLWKARLMRIAPWLVDTERRRQSDAHVAATEVRGTLELPDLGFKIVGTADRIDRTQYGHARLYDYKTGNPPTAKEQKAFDKQLMLETAMLERGSFDKMPPAQVERAAYIGLGNTPKETDSAQFDSEDWGRFLSLIQAVLSETHGFTARRAMKFDEDGGDYDHLSRHGEWSTTDVATKVALT